MTARYLRTFLFTGPLVVLSTIVMGLLSLFVSLFDRTGRTQHKMAQIWSRLLLAVGFVEVETEGVEKLQPNSSYVLVANHSSYYDTPVVLANIPLQFRFLAKKGLFDIPLLGTHLKRAGHFPVTRDDPRSAVRLMGEVARQLGERRLSVLLFPEGGRSENALREFKEGAAHLAIRAGVPVVPVGIIGTRHVLRMHTFHVLPGKVRLRVGDPIETAGMGPRDRAALTQTLTEKVAELTGEPVPASPATP
jgi:1-acyl-sn-glycerol-3-phosphate acyltransferase